MNSRLGNKLKKWSFRFLLCAGTALALPACVSVAAYEKMYLNDEDMALRQSGIESYEINVEAYREGAAGINGGKTGGGCGCN